MRLLLDANLSPEVARRLNAAGNVKVKVTITFTRSTGPRSAK